MRRKISLVLFSLIIALILVVGCAGDPLADIFMSNIYPGETDTYDFGSPAYRWDEGHFRIIYADNITGNITEVDPVFIASDAFPITAAEIAAWNAHPPLTTGIHGVGAGSVVGTTLVQELTNKTLTDDVGKGTWTADGVWKLPAMFFNGDITTDRWTSLEGNTFFGTRVASAGDLNGDHNTFVGHHVGNFITDGDYNCAWGSHALFFIEDGNGNVGVGYQTGGKIVDGNYNVMIGGGSGPTSDGSYGLYIDREESDTPLISGNFSTDDLHFYAATKTGLDNTNYTSFEDDGTMEMVGDATVWDDIFMPTSGAKVPAVNTPNWEAFTANTSEYTFALNDYADLTTVEINHDYKEGTNIGVHLHIVTNGLDANERKARYTVYYTWGDMNEVMSAEGSLTAELTIPLNTTDMTHLLLDMGDITGTGYKIGSLFKCRVKRIAGTGTEPTSDPFVSMVGIHYQIDTIGSRTELVK